MLETITIAALLSSNPAQAQCIDGLNIDLYVQEISGDPFSDTFYSTEVNVNDVVLSLVKPTYQKLIKAIGHKVPFNVSVNRYEENQEIEDDGRIKVFYVEQEQFGPLRFKESNKDITQLLSEFENEGIIIHSQRKSFAELYSRNPDRFVADLSRSPDMYVKNSLLGKAVNFGSKILIFPMSLEDKKDFVNVKGWDFTKAYIENLSYILTHETGHVLGLEEAKWRHINNDTKDVMGNYFDVSNPMIILDQSYAFSEIDGYTLKEKFCPQ